jgi:hypothetical protein
LRRWIEAEKLGVETGGEFLRPLDGISIGKPTFSGICSVLSMPPSVVAGAAPR